MPDNIRNPGIYFLYPDNTGSVHLVLKLNECFCNQDACFQSPEFFQRLKIRIVSARRILCLMGKHGFFFQFADAGDVNVICRRKMHGLAAGIHFVEIKLEFPV